MRPQGHHGGAAGVLLVWLMPSLRAPVSAGPILAMTFGAAAHDKRMFFSGASPSTSPVARQDMPNPCGLRAPAAHAAPPRRTRLGVNSRPSPSAGLRNEVIAFSITLLWGLVLGFILSPLGNDPGYEWPTPEMAWAAMSVIRKAARSR